jgi:hypothetical protein
MMAPRLVRVLTLVSEAGAAGADKEMSLPALGSTQGADEKYGKNDQRRARNEMNEDDTKPEQRIEVGLEEGKNDIRLRHI